MRPWALHRVALAAGGVMVTEGYQVFTSTQTRSHCFPHKQHILPVSIWSPLYNLAAQKYFKGCCTMTTLRSICKQQFGLNRLNRGILEITFSVRNKY